MAKTLLVVIFISASVGFGATRIIARFKQEQMENKQSKTKKKSIGEIEAENATTIQEGIMSPTQVSHGKLYAVPGKKENLVTKRDQYKNERVTTIITRGWGSSDEYNEGDDIQSLASNACHSDLVVIGQITSRASQFNEDQTYIFTDYDVKIESILKNNSTSEINTDTPLVVSGGGGSVKLNDRIIGFHDKSYAEYDKNGRYVLFLKYIPAATVFKSSIGHRYYKLDNGQLKTEKDLDQANIITSAYREEATFISEVRTAIATSCSNDGRDK